MYTTHFTRWLQLNSDWSKLASVNREAKSTRTSSQTCVVTLYILLVWAFPGVTDYHRSQTILNFAKKTFDSGTCILNALWPLSKGWLSVTRSSPMRSTTTWSHFETQATNKMRSIVLEGYSWFWQLCTSEETYSRLIGVSSTSFVDSKHFR